MIDALLGTGLQERLPALDAFPSLQLGSAPVVGKPYDGPADTEAVKIIKNVRSLINRAKVIETCPTPT